MSRKVHFMSPEQIKRIEAAERRQRSFEHFGTVKPEKGAMEEATLQTCPECGYGSGRHSRSCAGRDI